MISLLLLLCLGCEDKDSVWIPPSGGGNNNSDVYIPEDTSKPDENDPAQKIQIQIKKTPMTLIKMILAAIKMIPVVNPSMALSSMIPIALAAMEKMVKVAVRQTSATP